ncbi:unnamed protein product, partial [Lymnaea stagnalis]
VDSNNSARGKRSAKSPVDKARQLVDTLSNLEQETAQSIWGPRDSRLAQNTPMEVTGPAPIERYLTYPHQEGSPYPKLHQHSREKKSQQLKLDNLMVAKNVLKNLETTRETLEKNIDHVIRSRRDINVFTTMFGEGVEGAVAEQLRIEKLVNKKISALQPDVQREVLRGLAQEEADKVAAQTEEARLKIAAKRGTGKYGTTKAGLVKTQAERSARLAYNKPTALASAVVSSRGKENTSSKVKPPPKLTVIKDEKTLVRTYGKQEYQRGRTTIRDPYLHFKNPKTGRTARPAPVNESFVSGDGRSRSPKSRLGQGQASSPPPRQFYFSPTRGYIPLNAGDNAPVPGQLIPMAIPLGEPRMEPGVRRSATLLSNPLNPITSTPVPVTAATNVAVVSFPVEDRRTKKGREPELATQVLPPIDIDSISPSSSQRSDIQIRSPQQDNANVTFMYDAHHADVDLDNTLTEDNSEMEQSGEGINLPGYVAPYSEYSGPEFPPTNKPKADWTAGESQGRPVTLVSDVIAEDLRQRDILESNAVHWLEQELMAHVLSQVMAPLQRPHQTDTRVELDKSEDTDQEESLMVADMLGQGGMQLFIDAGQPVDNALVQALVKEVLQEKINTMLAQRSAEVDTQGVKVKDAVDEAMEARDNEFERGPPRVQTPEPTPKASPIASPRRVKPQPLTGLTTPPLSPPAAGFRMRQPVYEPEPNPQIQRASETVTTDKESDTDLSVSVDISEELRRVAAKGKSVDQEEPIIEDHDVATPSLSPMATPPMSPDSPPRHTTPPASPVQATIMKSEIVEEPVQRKTIVVEEEEEEAEDDGEEEEDDVDRVELDQPKPLLLSVAVGRDGPMTIEMSTSPGPKSSSPERQLSLSSPEPSSSETDSSLTDTVNDAISDGQWLLSEGQVIGLPLNEAKRQKFLHKGHQYVGDVSTASTLRDTEDLVLDETDYPKSEGEFLLTGLPAPESDPMLELLAQMQRNPFQISHREIPVPQVRQILSGPQPKEVMSTTGRSLGEMSVGQVPPSRLAMELRNGIRKTGRQSPSNSLERSEEEYDRNEDQRRRRRPDVEHRSRTPSPVVQQYEQSSRSPSPDHRRRPSPDQRSRPTRTSRSPSPQKPQQGGIRGRPQRQMQYQPVLSEGAPLPTRGKTPPPYGRRSSDSRISQSSDFGTRMSRSSYPSESLSRSAESPILRRSGDGALTSSLKSRQSGVKKSVEFDLTGTYDKSNRWESPVPNSDPSRSLGLNYSLDDSYDETDLRKIVHSTGSRSGPYRMSVTIPSTADEAESDISEIDLSNNGFQ